MQAIFDPKRPVFIIGGGASLRDFTWDRLKKKQTIVLNLAYRMVPWADVMFFGDNRFLDKYGDPSPSHHFYQFKGRSIVTTAPHAGGCWGGRDNRVLYVSPENLAVTMGDVTVDATNKCTGAQSILLAHHLGAQQIVLLGFDNKPGHWAALKHYAYPRPCEPEAYQTYAANFAEVAQLGLSVVNATPGSALDCFPISEPNAFF